MSIWITLISVILIILGVIKLIQNPNMEHKNLTIVVLVLLVVFTALNALGI